MSIVTFYSLDGVVNEGAIRRLGKNFNYTIKVIEQDEGYIKFETTPDLSAGHKTSLLTGKIITIS